MEESDIDLPMRRVSAQKVRDDSRIARSNSTTTDYWIRGTESGKFPLSMRGCFWLGSFVAVLLIAFSLFQVVPSVERNLEQRAVSELNAAGIETGGLEVDFSWRDGDISGLVATEDSADVILDTVSGLDGVRSVELNLDVAETPTSTTTPGSPRAIGPVSVIVQFTGGGSSLSGTVLTEQQRSELVSAAEAAMGAENVSDRLQVSGLLPELEGADERVKSMASVIAKIQAPTSGRIVLVDGSLSSSLSVPTEENVVLLEEAFAESGLVGERQIEVETVRDLDPDPDPDPEPEPDPASAVLLPAEQAAALQAELDLLQAEVAANVVFGANQSSLSAEAQLTLDKVAAAMNQYLQTSIEVEGHTDSAGVESENRQLSQERADAVAAYLISAGVEARRLSAIGYGQDRPVGDNSTNAGRQANRRVQFTASELAP